MEDYGQGVAFGVFLASALLFRIPSFADRLCKNIWQADGWGFRGSIQQEIIHLE